MTKTSKTTQSSGTSPVFASSNLAKTSEAGKRREAGRRVVFFGNERIATGVETSLPVLNMLLDEGYDVVAVVTSDSGTTSRKSRELEIEKLARERNIAFYNPRSAQALKDVVAGLEVEIAVLVAYGRIVPESVIEHFPYGIVNVHPSALPKHRGSAPIESVMLDGSTETAVSLMSLVKAMDAGPVYAHCPITLEGNETKQYLADTFGLIGAEALRELLPLLLSEECIARPQDHAAATYDERIAKSDGMIDLSKTAVQLEREVRAYASWPGSHTRIAGKNVIITVAHVADNTLQNVDKKTIFAANKALCLQTADGILVVDELKPAGKSTMPAAAFLAGYGQLLDSSD